VPQAYSPEFARVYDELFTSFAVDVAPRIHDFYAAQPPPPHHLEMLDVCCGTGQCARFFLDRGFRVTGVDLSEAMLAHARKNAGEHLSSGAARFVQADASDFAVDAEFGLVISTFDALNHLPDETALESCFRSVAAATARGGWFVFDLNTRGGIGRWNGVTVTDSDDTYLVRRGAYDGGLRAETVITGFMREHDGRYARLEETVYNTLFETARVAELLAQTGWQSAYFATLDDLGRAVDNPEQESRIFIVAQR
jgi:SAM-dependent methyltransferase